VAGIGPGDLHILAEEFLDACIEALDTIPTYDATLAGAPSRTFVAPGPVALDCCEQLAVHVGLISEGHAVIEAARINHATFTVTASRCVPVPDDQGNPPPAAEINAAAEQINADKWALWNHIGNMIDQDMLFDKCCGVDWGPLSPLQPNGGCGGSVLSITVCLDGYEEVLGT
jgi:hypothetical protein